MTTSREEQARAREAAFKLYRNASDPVEKLRVYAISRGVNGIESLNKIFRDMDIKGRSDRHMSKDEFVRGLSAFGFEASRKEMGAVFDAIDNKRNGFIDYVDFIEDMRPSVSSRRQALIRNAFDSVDSSGNGVITVKELERALDFSHNEDVRSGSQTETQVMKRFLRQIGGSDDGGAVTWKEFNDYYSGLSASVDNDSYFEDLMTSAYGIDASGGGGNHGANRSRGGTRFPRIASHRGGGRQHSEGFFSNWESYHPDARSGRGNRSHSAGFNSSSNAQRGFGDEPDWMERKWLQEVQEETGEDVSRRRARSFDKRSNSQDSLELREGSRGKKRSRNGYYKKFTESKINWLNKWNKNLNSEQVHSHHRKSFSNSTGKSGHKSKGSKNKKGYWFADWEDVHGIDLSDPRLDKNGNARGYERSRSLGGRGDKLNLDDWENAHNKMGIDTDSFTGSRRSKRRRPRSADYSRRRSSRETRRHNYYS